MNLPLKSALSAIAIVALAAPALAQVQPPSPRTPVGAKPPQVRGVFAREHDISNNRNNTGASATAYARAATIAECIVRFGKNRAPDLLGGSLAGDPGYAKLERGLRGRFGDCAADLEAPAMMISGALAERLTLAESNASADRAQSVNVDEATKFHGDLSGQVTLESIAGCLAVYSPGLTYKVLSTDIESDEETAALKALYAATPECGMREAPSGIESGYQRGALATALYARTHRNS